MLFFTSKARLVAIAAFILFAGTIAVVFSNGHEGPSWRDRLMVYTLLQGASTDTEQVQYSWNQKMTLVVETDQGVFEGSSIIKVTWRKNPHRVNDALWLPEIEGEAPSVVLPDGTRLYGLLGNTTPAWLPFENARDFIVTEDMLREIVGMHDVARFENPYLAYPDLVGFSDPSKHVSVYYAKPVHNVVSTTLIVEKTKQSVPRETITQSLPWLLKSRRELIEDTGGAPMAASYSNDGGITQQSASKFDLLRNSEIDKFD